MTLTLTNTGSADLTVSAINTPRAPFTQLVGTCMPMPFVLAPAASCDLAYEFSPSSVNIFSETIDISSDASSSPDSFQLMGQGGDAGIVLSSNLLDLGATPLGGANDALLNISNTGTVDLIITDIQGPNAPFSLNDVNCGPVPFQVMPASGCDLVLSFQPTQVGTVSDSFNIISNDPNSPETVSVTGLGFLILEVPTLQQRAMIAMALFLLLLGVWRLKRIN